MSVPEQEELLQRITYESGIFNGKATVRGMRISVITVLELLASGMKVEEILEDYPYLEEQDIQACLLFAAQTLSRNAA